MRKNVILHSFLFSANEFMSFVLLSHCIQGPWKALPFPQGVFLGSSTHFPYIQWYSSIFATFSVFLITHLFIFKVFLINFAPLNLEITLGGTLFLFESNFFFSLCCCSSSYKVQFSYEKNIFQIPDTLKIDIDTFQVHYLCWKSLCPHTWHWQHFLIYF